MKRIENKKLLKEIGQKPCEICESPNGVSAHHIITRARQGGDVEWNLMPLCFSHHREWHDRPISEMIRKYPQLEGLLLKRGFTYDEGIKKLLCSKQNT